MASTTIDIGSTCNYRVSVVTAATVSPQSGIIVGEIVDLMDDNHYCNVFVAGGPSSGGLAVQLQTSETTTSGDFTDPTSGLAVNNGVVDSTVGVVSGGIFHVNSGYASGAAGTPTSGRAPLSPTTSGSTYYASGGIQFGAFVRPHRYARLILQSGDFGQPVVAGFVSQRRTTGSGAGFANAPALSGSQVYV